MLLPGYRFDFKQLPNGWHLPGIAQVQPASPSQIHAPSQLPNSLLTWPKCTAEGQLLGQASCIAFAHGGEQPRMSNGTVLQGVSETVPG